MPIYAQQQKRRHGQCGARQRDAHEAAVEGIERRMAEVAHPEQLAEQHQQKRFNEPQAPLRPGFEVRVTEYPRATSDQHLPDARHRQ